MVLNCLHVRNAPVETLSLENTQFNLSYVEPASVLGGIMNFKALSQPTGFFRAIFLNLLKPFRSMIAYLR